ncbi:MAG: iron ABC transporter ATP-binding protein [Bacteroidetes bacterium QS_8_68_15]|nr:MAG: iron ABC transporter ATP-binding protein [Bacteroidetes bacterium QS_8_68_15]
MDVTLPHLHTSTPPYPEVLLTAAGLTKRFAPGDAPVVQDVDLGVEEGEIFSVLGPSGCGKTTTLRLLAGFERPDAGRVQLDGRTLCAAKGGRFVPPEERGLGFVFQDYALFPHLSVLENAAFGLKGQPDAEERAREALDAAGLGDLTGRRPHELSGGQQQRVALARTLAARPSVVLLDEPFGGLDALLRQETRDRVRRRFKDAGATAILVTHDQQEALSFADRVAVMKGGRIEQVGTPEEVYHRPRTLFVAQFLGRTNLLFSEAHGAEAETPLGRLRLSREAQGQVLLSLRPEHLTLETMEAPAGDAPAGTVVRRAFKGHDVTYRVAAASDAGGTEYLVHTPSRVAFSEGDRVRIRPQAPAVVLERGEPHES